MKLLLRLVGCDGLCRGERPGTASTSTYRSSRRLRGQDVGRLRNGPWSQPLRLDASGDRVRYLGSRRSGLWHLSARPTRAPSGVVMLDNEGWSLYGAQRSQLVATGGKWEFDLHVCLKAALKLHSGQRVARLGQCSRMSLDGGLARRLLVARLGSIDRLRLVWQQEPPAVRLARSAMRFRN
jgi:hypothetical protein